MSLKSLGQRVTTTGRETVQGGGTVSVTVDRAWFAWGIGMVQEQVFTTSAGHNFPAQVEDLKSFTKE
jgi:hypothetical protein